MVTIKADRAGLQLAKFGDVRINGVLVGQVRSISQDGEEAAIKVALEPDAAARSPSNVEVQILPTTLFGQKFISFVAARRPVGAPRSQDGDVIPPDRVETNVELSRILAEPVPAAALGAAGRPQRHPERARDRPRRPGRATSAQTLDKLDAYLGAIDDHLPTLREDLVLLAEVADTYDVAAPDLLGVLDNVTVTSRTIVDQRKAARRLLRRRRRPGGHLAHAARRQRGRT